MIFSANGEPLSELELPVLFYVVMSCAHRQPFYSLLNSTIGIIALSIGGHSDIHL